MEFDHNYYEANKFLLSSLGFWPYQTRAEKIIRRCVLLFIILSNFPPMIRYFHNIWGDFDHMIYCLIFSASATLSVAKIFKAVISDEETKNLLEQIKCDWNLWFSEPEVVILAKYAQEVRKLTLAYVVTSYCSVAFYIAFTLSPHIFHHINSLQNSTRERIYLIPQDFGIKTDKYFSYIFIFNVISIYTNLTITLGIDTMYIVFVQHACGIFAAIGSRFENIDNVAQLQKSGENYSKFVTQENFFCFQQYGSVLKYAANVKEYYAMYFLFLTGGNALILILCGVQTVISFGNFLEFVKFSNYTILLLIHLCCNSMCGQKLMDHSLTIFQATYNVCWYEMSISLKKSLIIVMMRSSKSCTISIGKIYVMSMDNFTVVVRTALSYITMLLSLR